jgi:AraC-like DNA-binding protein
MDPAALLAQAGLAPDDLNDPENRVPWPAVARLMEDCVTLSGCEHFALLIGREWELADLGFLGELGRHCPTVGQAVRTMVVYQQINSQGGAPYLVEHHRVAILGYTVFHPGVQRVWAASEAAMAMFANLVRELAGGNPGLVEVTLPRPPPRDPTPYRRHFGCPVQFDAGQATLCLPAEAMDLPVLGADPIRRRLLEAEARRRVEGSFEVNLYRAIGTLLMMGMPSGDAVAQQLALHRRTLNRRLKAQGRTFQSVLDAVRFDFARRLLRDTRLPVTAVAATLGYSEASSFARAFRRWSGSGPLDWRRAEQGP